ncbi:MAG: hypothetical protein JOZ86_00615 [Candidatus Eremiobacteraeota bacterium]|nr:hypothetical protein [Candidatus Eremiobacteraeota bacterium]
MRALLAVALGAVLIAAGACGARAKTVSVPVVCTPGVNARLAQLIAEHHDGPVDNVLVCGTTLEPSRPQRGFRGYHELIPLRVPLANDGSIAWVEVVTNDDLDGVVHAPRNATVYAYGQYFLTTKRQRPFVAGIHDVHCATHRGADDGWVVVNGAKYPRVGCGG